LEEDKSNFNESLSTQQEAIVLSNPQLAFIKSDYDRNRAALDMISMDLANLNSSIDLKQRELNQIKIAMDSLHTEKEMTIEYYQS
jgi:hypothetical protein